ncbi:MAG: hypothetical protein KAH01_00415 [Caldisericia bacterium]|nr:hypothetical protein [Caldisericia bacterium]
MENKERIAGLITGFSIGLLLAILFTPIKGVLFSKSRKKTIKKIFYSLPVILDSTLKFKNQSEPRKFQEGENNEKDSC